MDGTLRLGSRILRYSTYGSPDDPPVLSFGGSPSTRWKRPDAVAAMESSGLFMVLPDRPGYGGSTRRPGRTVASCAADAAALADSLGWSRFAVTGGSGGGPHALACAALLGDRVVRCAVTGSNAPALVDGLEPSSDDEAADPRRNRRSWLAARSPEQLLVQLQETARSIMTAVAEGGPEFPPQPGEAPGPPARDDADAMARLTATFITSHDGWLDDHVAFAQDWGFALSDIRVPVSVWYGPGDEPAAKVLLGEIPGAEPHPYTGGHIQPENVYREMLRWLTLS